MNDLNEIIRLLTKPTNEDIEVLTRAHEFARNVHKDNKRISGEPYAVHSFETAKTLAGLNMNANTVTAGLLHDTLGESGVTEEMLEKEFGADIAFLVSSFHKLDSIRYQGDERYAENLRKLFMLTAKDIRVLIIRFAHRLHNVKTLNSLPEEKRGRVALETLEIYAPIANRLGMYKLKGELEDAAFKYVHPAEYKTVLGILKRNKVGIDDQLKKFSHEIQKKLAQENIKFTKVSARIKQLYSLYRKLQDHEMDVDRIFDIAALRIIVSDIGECYRVLGLVHNTWKPVPSRPVRDYIAVPKPNGYRSIHTAVFTGNGKTIEVQIRTEEMDKEAEYGIASYLAYSESGKPLTGGIISRKLRWLKQLLEWQKNVNESKEFIENLKMDFFKDRVFAFTPRGDVVELPERASVIDFSYAIHSDLGNHTAGAKVNGKFVALDETITNGDVVEIQRKKVGAPSHKWLEIAKTSLAKKHIRLELIKLKKI